MRELTISELGLVGGMGVLDDVLNAFTNAASVGGLSGMAAGAAAATYAESRGATVATQIALANKAAIHFSWQGAVLTLAFEGGMWVGNWLNENTSIQAEIANFLDGSGTNYSD